MGQSGVERLQRLEGQYRRLKLAGLGVLVLAGAALLIGQAPLHRMNEAEMFVLRDTNGKVRAELGMGVHGPILALYDEDGRTRRLALGMAEKGPVLFIFDNTEQRRVALGLGEKGGAIALYDSDGNLVFVRPEK